MRRLFLPALLSLMILLAAALPSQAGLEWCPSDPVVEIGGVSVQIIVALPEQYMEAVTGPTHVEIITPKGVERELISTDSGFLGHGEVVTFLDAEGGDLEGKARRHSRKGLPVLVRVRVPIEASTLASIGSVPVALTIIPEGRDAFTTYGDSEGTQKAFSVKGAKHGRR